MNCQVGGIVITNRPDSKNAQYQSCIKQGDILLNRCGWGLLIVFIVNIVLIFLIFRVQKLSRVINI